MRIVAVTRSSRIQYLGVGCRSFSFGDYRRQPCFVHGNGSHNTDAAAASAGHGLLIAVLVPQYNFAGIDIGGYRLIQSPEGKRKQIHGAADGAGRRGAGLQDSHRTRPIGAAYHRKAVDERAYLHILQHSRIVMDGDRFGIHTAGHIG
ncbi:hypothetical protein D3C75_643160 [compost metagenome]